MNLNCFHSNEFGRNGLHFVFRRSPDTGSDDYSSRTKKTNSPVEAFYEDVLNTSVDILNKADQQAGAKISGRQKQEPVKSPRSTRVCRETKGKKNGALNLACRTKDMETEEQTRLIESLRSEPAMRELSKNVQVPEGEPFKIIYPGAGGDLGGLMMAAGVIDQGKAMKAEIILTDIDDCKFIEFWNNLDQLVHLHPDFENDSGDRPIKLKGKAGVEKEYATLYKGKFPIKVKFLLNMSGGEYYRKDDVDKSHLAVLHDSPGEHTEQVLGLLSKYIASRSNAKNGLSQVIVEDLTHIRHDDFDKSDGFYREVDLEFFGMLHRGTHPYGHREHERLETEGFSQGQACNLRKDDDNDIDDNTIQTWVESGDAPREHMDVYVETGQPIATGAILTLHPELSNLSSNQVNMLMEISLAGLNNYDYNFGIKRRRIGKYGDHDRNNMLFTAQFYGDVIENSKEIVEVMQDIDPKLASIFAIRVFQVLLKGQNIDLFKHIEDKNIESHKKGYDEINAFVDEMEGYLDEVTLKKLTKPLATLRRHLSFDKSDLEGHYEEGEKRKKAIEKCRVVAEGILES